MSLGSLSLGRGSSTPSTPPSDAPSSNHYIPHSQTPAGRTSTESTRAAQAHIQAVVTHRHSVDIPTPAKLQKKKSPRQGHVRTQSATSISSFTVGFAPGLPSGFGGVILHGLATFGFAARAVLAAVGGSQPGALRYFGVRFSSPVKPGDALETSIWEVGPARAPGHEGETEVAFVTRNVATGKVCLGAGVAYVRKAEGTERSKL